MAKTLAQKDWYKIVAPDIFDNKEISQTPADSSENLEGRQVKVELKKLLPKTDKYYMDVYLKLDEVKGDRVSTKLAGHECSRQYVSRLVRRNSDRIDLVEDYETDDGKDVRVKMIAITLKKVNSSIEKKLRKKIAEVVEEKIEGKNFDEFMDSVFSNEVQKEIYNEVKQIYPLRTVEFRKTELI